MKTLQGIKKDNLTVDERYYKENLDRLDTGNIVHITLGDSVRSTNTLNLNKTSVKMLRRFLTKLARSGYYNKFD